MPFGIPKDDFLSKFGIPEKEVIERVEKRDLEQEYRQRLIACADKIGDDQERLLTELLIEAGVTWAPRGVARFLLSRGVSIKV